MRASILSVVSSLMIAAQAAPAGRISPEIHGQLVLNDHDFDNLGWHNVVHPGKKLPEVDSEALQSLIDTSALRHRAEVLYNISLTSVGEYGNPTRVIGSPGHWNTIHYIASELNKLHGYYKVKTQRLNAIDGKVSSYSLLIDGAEPKSVLPLSLTPPTPDKKPVHGNLVLVDTDGCSLENFPSNTKGNIALIKRGGCYFSEISTNAGLAGASAIVIYTDEGPLHGSLSNPTGKEVPSLSVEQKHVQKYIDKLKEHHDAQIEATVYIDSYVKNVTTLNVIAETVHGDHNNVVSLGAHSDSVNAGPGINDDGSGTISLLEVAKQLTNFKVNNAVRFAWWTAEEEGLFGSTHYAESLSPEENQKIRVFMDYDMMASPNYVYEVYDANNEDHPNGSGNLRDLYIDYYVSHGLNYTLAPFDGRSDYVGFLEAGIPCGGVDTGAEGVKDGKLKEKFGGKEGEWFDQCYHQLCDNLSNPSYEAWLTNTKLIAHSVAVYAKSFEGFPEREPLKQKSKSNFKYRGGQLIM